VSPSKTDADRAGDAQLVQLLLGEVQILAGSLRDLGGGAVGVQLQVHHDLAHIVVHDGLQYAVLGIAVRDAGVGEAFETDLGCQLQYVRSVCHAVPSFRYLLSEIYTIDALPVRIFGHVNYKVYALELFKW
jgi:hypothetical protein